MQVEPWWASGTGTLNQYIESRFDAQMPRTARPLAADRLKPSVSNPQTWKRYACVGNNPASFTDPSGLMTINPNWYMGFGGGWAWEMVGA